jgi:hypothetical protein
MSTHFYRDTNLGRNYLLFAMSFLLASAIFAFAWILSFASRLRPFLSVSTGIVSVTAYPAGCLFSRWYWFRVPLAQLVLLLVEMMIVTVAAILYFKHLWPIRNSLTVFLLTAHFIFWLWYSESLSQALEIANAYGAGHANSWSAMFNALVLPTLGLLSSLAWARYLNFTWTTSAVSIN